MTQLFSLDGQKIGATFHVAKLKKPWIQRVRLG